MINQLPFKNSDLLSLRVTRESRVGSTRKGVGINAPECLAKALRVWTRWLKRNTGNEYLIQAWPRHKSSKVRYKLPPLAVMVFMVHSRRR